MNKIDLSKAKVISNPRPEPNVFENVNASCSFCSSYIPQVLEIPECLEAFTKDPFLSDVFICRSCLEKLCNQLDKAMVDSFFDTIKEKG